MNHQPNIFLKTVAFLVGCLHLLVPAGFTLKHNLCSFVVQYLKQNTSKQLLLIGFGSSPSKPGLSFQMPFCPETFPHQRNQKPPDNYDHPTCSQCPALYSYPMLWYQFTLVT